MAQRTAEDQAAEDDKLVEKKYSGSDVRRARSDAYFGGFVVGMVFMLAVCIFIVDTLPRTPPRIAAGGRLEASVSSTAIHIASTEKIAVLVGTALVNRPVAIALPRCAELDELGYDGSASCLSPGGQILQTGGD